MNYRVSWYQPGRIVLFELLNVIIETDLEQLDQDFFTCLDQADGPLVHFLFEFDLDESSRRPDLRQMTNMQFVRDPRTGWILAIGKPNSIIKFLISTAAQINKARFRMFETREQALDFLQDVDATLPQLTPPSVNETEKP